MITKRIQYAFERLILLCIRPFLVKYSAVIAQHVDRLDIEAAKFKNEVILVCTDHFRHLNALHSRLLKLENEKAAEYLEKHGSSN